jgi:DNA-binding NarL/FixJ family response regulator
MLGLKPDLIILDLTMPVLGGFSAAMQLRELLPEMPILFYSMHEGAHLVSEAKQIGVRGFVSKSHISETLLAAVDALVLRKSTFFRRNRPTTPNGGVRRSTPCMCRARREQRS